MDEPKNPFRWRYLLISAAIHGSVIVLLGLGLMHRPAEYAFGRTAAEPVRVTLLGPESIPPEPAPAVAEPVAPPPPAPLIPTPAPLVPKEKPILVEKKKPQPMKPAAAVTRQTVAPVAAQATGPVLNPSANPEGESTQPTGPRQATAADYLSNPAPRYPIVSKRNGEEGTVVLRVSIGADGTVQDLQLKSSSGHERLDRSAMESVSGWKFKPPTVLNIPVGGTVLVPIRFVLD